MSLAQRITDLTTAVREKFNLLVPKLVPTGGTTGQALVKTSNANNAVSWQSVSGGGAAPTFAQSRWVFNDYHGQAVGQTDPFASTAISTGTFTTAPAIGDALHPGLLFIRSSATANSGVRALSVQPLISAQGLIYRGVFRTAPVLTLLTQYWGFHDSVTSAQPVDGAYIKIVGATATAETAANSVRTTSGTTLTLAVNTFYTFDVEYLTATSVRFVITDDAGTKLYDQTIATNVPQLIARSFFAGCTITQSGTVAIELGYIDYQGFGPARPSYIVTPP